MMARRRRTAQNDNCAAILLISAAAVGGLVMLLGWLAAHPYLSVPLGVAAATGAGFRIRSRIQARELARVRAVEQAQIQAVRAAVQALSSATDEFAARRMDRSIRKALSGRKLDELA